MILWVKILVFKKLNPKLNVKSLSPRSFDVFVLNVMNPSSDLLLKNTATIAYKKS